MSRAYDLFRPGRLKLLLAATFVIPVFFVLFMGGDLLYRDLLFPAVLSVVLSYGAACVIDDIVQSRSLKIALASAAALVSIVLGSLLVRSMTMVCDPVHDPGLVCDPVHVPETPTTVPTVINTVGPGETPPMIFDPVHEPGSCSQACDTAASVPSGAVAGKLEECLRSCGR